MQCHSAMGRAERWLRENPVCNQLLAASPCHGCLCVACIVNTTEGSVAKSSAGFGHVGVEE